MISLACLAIMIHFEARGEPPVGKLAVAHATLRRTSPDRSVCDVIKSPGQYPWVPFRMPLGYANGLQPDSPAMVEAFKFAHIAMTTPDFTRGSDHFHSVKISKPASWSGLKHCGTWGDHHFYARKCT